MAWPSTLNNDSSSNFNSGAPEMGLLAEIKHPAKAKHDIRSSLDKTQ